MDPISREYLDKQRSFWNVDRETARLGRVDTDSVSDSEYENAADVAFDAIFAGRNLTGCTILELGCGVGRLLSRVLTRTQPGLVIGLDISENMIRYARESLGPRSNLRLGVNSGSDLSGIADASIDFAYAKDVFIHIHDISVASQYLREIRRVLKTSGSFWFNVARFAPHSFGRTPGGLWATAAYVIGLRSPLKRNAEPIPGFDGVRYRPKDLRALAAKVGLSVTHLKPEGTHISCCCAKLT